MLMSKFRYVLSQQMWRFIAKGIHFVPQIWHQTFWTVLLFLWNVTNVLERLMKLWFPHTLQMFLEIENAGGNLECHIWNVWVFHHVVQFYLLSKKIISKNKNTSKQKPNLNSPVDLFLSLFCESIEEIFAAHSFWSVLTNRIKH